VLKPTILSFLDACIQDLPIILIASQQARHYILKPKSIFPRTGSYLLRSIRLLVNLLSQRQEIEETVDRLGLYLDGKEWMELEEILELDYVSMVGGQVEKLPRSDVVAWWRGQLSPLKATQHIITNLHITIKTDNTADCAANVLAMHVRPNQMGDSLWTVGGRYDFNLIHDGGHWRISAVKLTVLWTTGNPQILNESATSQM
jgi:hypothetical protein